MGQEDLPMQSKNQITLISANERKNDIEYISKTFKVAETVNKLYHMMNEVTKGEINAKNVNAACHCISQLNATMNTTINAARFLRER